MPNKPVNLQASRCKWNRVLAATACLLACGPATGSAGPAFVDEFERLDPWTVRASDGVVASIQSAAGIDGQCLRLDFDFRAGAGFVVVRRAVDLDPAENYRFTFAVRGDALPNNFEFKLIDASGENVWWVNRRDFDFPNDWLPIRYKQRHFEFAWGPSGGAPLERIAAIEFAVAASQGGAGKLFIDDLTFETLPEARSISESPLVRCSSSADGASKSPRRLPLDGGFAWTSAAGDPQPWIEVDLHAVCEFGGLTLEWADGQPARDYTVALSLDGQNWEIAAEVRGGNGGRDHVALPDAEARYVRLAMQAPDGGAVGLRRIELRPLAYSQSSNALYATLAREAPRGRFPGHLLSEQVPWTVVGVAGDRDEALLNAHGAVELDKRGPSVEPFVWTGDRLITWADVECSQSLDAGYLPIPTVTWRAEGFTLAITAFAEGPAGKSQLVARYRLENTGRSALNGALFVTVRPLQVLPPWQNLNITGGVAPVRGIRATPRQMVIDPARTVTAWRPADACGAAAFDHGDITEYLATGTLPRHTEVEDPRASASAAWRFNYRLAPGESTTVVIAAPFHDQPVDVPGITDGDEIAAAVNRRIERVRTDWTARLNRARLHLPASARQIAETFRATQAYILINADGPSIQPGSRTYERSWMRDGALTSTALLSTGHADRVKEFLNWYAPHQFPDGKVPCVVDQRGPDPVPEHDSHGELIYALLTYYRYTGDRAFLETHWPRVVGAVNYIDGLRRQRMTEVYRNGTPEQRACYGLVPESISHEGYSAKPMHSYWDSFFVLRGLADAVTIAEILGRESEGARFAELRDAYARALSDSVRRAMSNRQIDFVPGCVELGDFDATSTAIALFPCDVAEVLPQAELARTFDRYYEFFVARREGRRAWRDYTPYELRLVGTFVLLDQPRRAHELLEFFMGDQRPAGWRHWAEVVWRDPRTPGFVGDMPHTWVGSAFMNSLRAMLVHEDGDALRLLAGVSPRWLTEDDGLRIEAFPTWFGTIDLSARVVDDALRVRISGAVRPVGGYGLVVPDRWRITRVRCDGTELAGQKVAGNMVALPASARDVVVELRQR
jgi:hypothetical protein